MTSAAVRDGIAIVTQVVAAMASAAHSKAVAGNSMIAAADHHVRKKWDLRKECG